jgi:polar amino acid transport system substrate-binding protein
MTLNLLPDVKRAPLPDHGDPAARALLDLMAMHDPGLRLHAEGVARVAVAVARALGLTPQRGERLRTAALLHDIGKLGIPSSVIQKPAPLTEREYGLVQRHPIWGFHILLGIDLKREARWVLHHHERPDGCGYPDRLRDGEIPFEASILHVADAFDALTTDRPYRTALSAAEALATIADGAETDFNAACVTGLEAAITDGVAQAPRRGGR